mmetsp:Transcript_47776/g.138096  ORF Transcript_47776/g.138096 Transcript_47776/m.138096 type:complete len:403 (-) Transcript_47776:588-1796(-)
MMVLRRHLVPLLLLRPASWASRCGAAAAASAQRQPSRWSRARSAEGLGAASGLLQAQDLREAGGSCCSPCAGARPWSPGACPASPRAPPAGPPAPCAPGARWSPWSSPRAASAGGAARGPCHGVPQVEHKLHAAWQVTPCGARAPRPGRPSAPRPPRPTSPPRPRPAGRRGRARPAARCAELSGRRAPRPSAARRAGAPPPLRGRPPGPRRPGLRPSRGSSTGPPLRARPRRAAPWSRGPPCSRPWRPRLLPRPSPWQPAPAPRPLPRPAQTALPPRLRPRQAPVASGASQEWNDAPLLLFLLLRQPPLLHAAQHRLAPAMTEPGSLQHVLQVQLGYYDALQPQGPWHSGCRLSCFPAQHAPQLRDGLYMPPRPPSSAPSLLQLSSTGQLAHSRTCTRPVAS